MHFGYTGQGRCENVIGGPLELLKGCLELLLLGYLWSLGEFFRLVSRMCEMLGRVLRDAAAKYWGSLFTVLGNIIRDSVRWGGYAFGKLLGMLFEIFALQRTHGREDAKEVSLRLGAFLA